MNMRMGRCFLREVGEDGRNESSDAAIKSLLCYAVCITRAKTRVKLPKSSMMVVQYLYQPDQTLVREMEEAATQTDWLYDFDETMGWY